MGAHLVLEGCIVEGSGGLLREFDLYCYGVYETYMNLKSSKENNMGSHLGRRYGNSGVLIRDLGKQLLC